MISCQIGSGYPSTITVNESTLEMRETGHREEFRGFSVFSSNPFYISYTLNIGDQWMMLKIPNDPKENMTMCFSKTSCEVCK